MINFPDSVTSGIGLTVSKHPAHVQHDIITIVKRKLHTNNYTCSNIITETTTI